jgi:hypothetical protein
LVEILDPQEKYAAGGLGRVEGGQRRKGVA